MSYIVGDGPLKCKNLGVFRHMKNKTGKKL
jgi:hypothetical protein